MLGFDRILLASDFSAGATAALHYAAAFARLSHASLQVLHVVDTRVRALPRWADVLHATDVFATMEAQGTDALQALTGHQALAGLTVDTILRHGHPADAIVDAAANADLVVMGTQGISTRDHGMGAMVRDIAHACPVPVLLVPPQGATAEATAPSLSLKEILLALHVVHYAPQAVHIAHTLATHCHATLGVLQVLDPEQPNTYLLDTGRGLSHNVDAMRAALRKHLEDVVPDTPDGPSIVRLVATGTPATAILQQAKERQADLVVMSIHAYSGWRRLFYLSTVDAVLEQLSCPLLVVPFLAPL